MRNRTIPALAVLLVSLSLFSASPASASSGWFSQSIYSIFSAVTSLINTKVSAYSSNDKGKGHGSDDSCQESDGKGKGKGHDKNKGKGHEHHKGKGKGHSHGCGDDDDDDDNSNGGDVVTAPIIEGNCAIYYAGQHTAVGSVCLTIQDDTVFVDYLLEGGWKLSDPHLWIGNTLASAPRTNSGNPIPGQFPFSANFHGKTEYTFEIPVSSLAIDADAVCAGDSTLLVAAHGSVSKGWKKESAWAGETRFVEKGNWATYFGIAPECGSTDPEPEPEPELPEGCFNVAAFGGEPNSFANLFGSDDFGYVVNGDAFFSEFSVPAITAEGNTLGQIEILSLAMGDPADGLYVELVANSGYSVRKTEIFAGDLGGYAPGTAFSESNTDIAGSAAYMFPAASSETLEVVVNAVMCEVDIDYNPSF